MKQALVAVAAWSVLFAGCVAPDGEAGGDRGIRLSNDRLVQAKRDTIPIYIEDSAGLGKGAAQPKSVQAVVGADSMVYNIVYTAQILAVDIAGSKVQANDILVDQSGHYGYIAYNYAGDRFAGAIQVIDITHKDVPEIVHEVTFDDMDINAVYLDGTDLIFCGAADPDHWGFKSFVGKVDTKNVVAADIAASVKGLPSHAATGVCRHGASYYVGVGAQDGRIMKLSLDFAVEDSLIVQDTRDVDAYQNGIIAVAGTTDNPNDVGRVVVAESNGFGQPRLTPIPDFGSDYHKATIEVFEGTLALLGLSEAGWKVMDMNNPGAFVYEGDNPAAPANIRPNTNSVSTDGNLIFTANGEYGFRVFRPKTKALRQIDLIGYYRSSIEPSPDINQRYSANHVELKSGYLFVAGGAQGVYVYHLESRTP